MHLLRGKKVSVNGGNVGWLPRRYGNSAVGDDVNFFTIDVAGIYVIVNWPRIGFSVMWDGSKK